MSRDPHELTIFKHADELALAAYRFTRDFPVEERFGLQAQIRRAAVSIPANIVEGCARNGERDFLHFVTIALGSASELRYLAGLAHRLNMGGDQQFGSFHDQCDRMVKTLNAFLSGARRRNSA